VRQDGHGSEAGLIVRTGAGSSVVCRSTVPGVVPRLSKTPGQVRGRGPRLGEHNGSGFDPA
jgi:crotonobetainyl-CoA:carnitine CoA-transferase CaiB-like acyl-CoA transferase